MRAKWNPKEKRWTATIGSGRSRRAFHSRVEGPVGEAAANARLDAYVIGTPPAKPGSLAEFIELVWWPRVQTKEPATQAKYESVLKTHFPDSLMSAPVASLGLQTLQPWISSVKGQPKTVRSVWGVMTAILSLAFDLGRLSDSSYRRVALPELPETEPVCIPDAHAEKIVKASRGHWLEAAVILGFEYGLRVSEMNGLKVTDIVIDGDEAEIRVARQRGTDGEKAKLKNKKAGHVRVIPTTAEKARCLLACAPQNAIYVCCGEQGRPVAKNAITKQFPALCARAGVPAYNAKDMRSTFATNLRRKGVPEPVTMRLLGHTTTKAHARYQSVSTDDMRRALR